MTTGSTTKPGNNSEPAPLTKAGAKTGANPFMLPPEEQFWKRYSPHYEMPISGVTSFLFHGVVLGLFLGLGILAAIMGWNRSQNLDFQAVRMPGGGGGNPNGDGNAPGIGSGFKEETQGNDTTDQHSVTPLPDTPPLNAEQVDVARKVFDTDVVRYINSGNPNIDKMMKNLNKDMLDKLRDGLMPGKGQGGTGSGGGTGTGTGTADGAAIGNSKGQLSERERRMLRWVMVFETANPNDYINQLAGLNAILAIPSGREGQYLTVRDLHKRPAKPESEDVAALNRIYWVDDKPNSVRGVLGVLGVRQPASHFVAFMPQQLEAKLFEKEIAYKNRREDEIFETKFKVIHRGGAYDVEVTQQTPTK
jgi:hypothetical protein